MRDDSLAQVERGRKTSYGERLTAYQLSQETQRERRAEAPGQ